MTLGLVASVQFSGVPAVKLTGTSTTGSPNPVPNNTLIDVFRTHADGSRHRVLTEPGPRLIGGGWAWIDIHCPYNQAVTYDITAAGSTVTSNPVFVPSKRAWLLHQSVASLAVMIESVREIGDRSTQTRATKFTPIGGKAFYISDGARDGVSGSISFRVSKTSPYEELFASDSLILINTPGTPGWDLGWMWVQPGNVQYTNPAGGQVSYPYRHVNMPFDESADPDMDLEPSWTFDDVTATYATFNALQAAYGTFLDLVTDTRL